MVTAVGNIAEGLGIVIEAAGGAVGDEEEALSLDEPWIGSGRRGSAATVPGGEATVKRIRRSPVGLGVALGAGIAFVSLFFTWIQVVTKEGYAEQYRAIVTFTGQSLMFAAILAALAGIGIAASVSGWRLASVVLALLMGGLLTAAAGWALLDPAGFAKYAADAQIFLSMTADWQGEAASEAVANAFASGALDASARIGPFIGLAGGALTIFGALLSFRRPTRV